MEKDRSSQCLLCGKLTQIVEGPLLAVYEGKRILSRIHFGTDANGRNNVSAASGNAMNP